jgi:hypothetical protein
MLLSSPDAPIIITEGEKKADAVPRLFPGYIGITSMGGAHAAKKSDWASLAGRISVIWPDSDEPGRSYAADVAALAMAAGAKSVAIVNVPKDWSDGWDLADPIPDGSDHGVLRALLAGARQWTSAAAIVAGTGSDFQAVSERLAALPPHEYDHVRQEEAKRLRVRQGTLDDAVKNARSPGHDEEEARVAPREQVIEIGMGCDLWRDPDYVAFATVCAKGHREHWRLRSEGFRRWLLHEYGMRFPATTNGRSHPTAPSDQSYREGLNTLEAIACNGPVRQPCVRVGGTKEGVIRFDLGTSDWSAIEISPQGWHVVAEAPLPLIRPIGMRPLPLPKRGDGINRLRTLVNVATENDFRLLVSFMAQAFRPSGPYAVLEFDGEQGTAKSSQARLIRRLVDPNKVLLSAKPKNEEDLIIAALNGQVVGFDNVSSIDPELADALCRLATGTGLRKRKLYTDDEETLITACRPIILNGIPLLATRSDLADRSIVLTSPPIPGDKRRTEAKYWAAVDEAAPEILAALLDGVVLALRDHAAIEEKLTQIPRMADFVCWAAAAAPAFGWTAENFHEAYSANRRDATEHAIEADSVALAVRDFAALGKWVGSATKLLTVLNSRISDDVRRTRTWPKGSAQLSGRLRRAAPALRRIGVRVDLDARHPETRVRQIEIEEDEKRRSERSESAGIQPVKRLRSGSAERCSNASQGFPNATAFDPNEAQNGGVCGEAAQTLAPNGVNVPNAVLTSLGEWQEEL